MEQIADRQDHRRSALSSTTPARMTGAQILWEVLAREGVEVVFGYPGGAIMPAYDALLASRIHHVLVRHEQGAVAHGRRLRARLGQGRASAVATSGPGATNLVTGIATAMLDSSPMVCITGQVASTLHRLRRLPGDRHHRHHPADHQAQLPGHPRRGPRPTPPRGVLRRPLRPARARCWSTSPRTRSRPRVDCTAGRRSRCGCPATAGRAAARARTADRARGELIDAARSGRSSSAGHGV